MNIHFAPIQGHTTAPYRYYHSQLYTPASVYYTPFIRLEKDDLRKRDRRELSSEMNEGINVIPQIIFRDVRELERLVDMVSETGAVRIDLNMGCPFPLQTGKGRGAAVIGNRELAESIVRLTEDKPEIEFSVKMRLGMNEPYEWKETLPILNRARLSHVTVHPRVARQQYSGIPDMKAFEEFYEQCELPLVYNGDLRTPEQFYGTPEKFPRLAGVMAGRGLLARPSLTSEINTGEEWDRVKRIDMLLRFHRQLNDHYTSTLCGDSQVLDNLKSFWEYLEDEIGRKPWKSIRKASNMAKYVSAVAMID